MNAPQQPAGFAGEVSPIGECSATLRLARVVHLLRATGETDALWAAAAIDSHLATGEPLERALGLAPRPGQRSAATCQAMAERNRLLRAAAAKHYGSLSVAGQAAQLHRVLSRYSASAWRLERGLSACPARHVGTPQEYAFAILKVSDGRVLAERTIRLALS